MEKLRSFNTFVLDLMSRYQIPAEFQIEELPFYFLLHSYLEQAKKILYLGAGTMPFIFPLTTHRIDSIQLLSSLLGKKEYFDLIYIDESIKLNELHSFIELIYFLSLPQTIIIIEQSKEAIIPLNIKLNFINDGTDYIIAKWSVLPTRHYIIPPTIVTALYDIRSKEENTSKDVRTIDFYLQHGYFYATLPYPVIIFTEEKLVESIKEIRKDYLTLTTIIVEPFEQTYFYKDKERLEQLITQYNIINRNPIKDTPLYIILNNNKFHWIERAIQINPYHSQHFIWMDFGITAVAKQEYLIHTWINTDIPDQIRQMIINPYLGEAEPSKYYQTIYHNMAGGLFTGSVEYLIKYIKRFKERYEQILTQGWYQLDEAIMSLLFYEDPDLFNPYYGDYDGIIANYKHYHRDFPLILMIHQKCLDRRRYKEAKKILDYIDPVIIHYQDLWEVYLYRRVLTDYYTDDKKLSQAFLRLMKKLKNLNPSKAKEIMKSWENNLKFYDNYNEL